jgi:hypothetical protein
MNAPRQIFAILLTIPAVHASTIDVSSSQTVVVNRGDTLSFELFNGSYRSAAQRFGLPLVTDVLRFALISAPLADGAALSVTLRSADSSFLVPLGAPLDFTSGYYSSGAFHGSVLTFHGQFELDTERSRNLLQSGSVWLDFTNHGAGFTLGLEPLLLGRDLYASLSGGPLSVGAAVGAVVLDHPAGAQAAGLALAAPPNALIATPEPAPVWTMLCGGGVILATSRALRRLLRI